MNISDSRIVMTLDAGGTNFRFSAMRGDKPVVPGVSQPSNGGDLNRCLTGIIEGFNTVKTQCPEPPVAISFAFPGPADYPSGIIGDLVNLPGFRNGVALGPMLEEKFRLPVFINNDGDLFALGESIAGFLPWVNQQLEKTGSPKRYRNLLGVTLGTGFGGGIVIHGKLLSGDNSMATEIHQLRSKIDPATDVEEGASIRAVRRVYASEAGIPFDQTPEPRVICEIASGKTPGNQAAAREAFRRMGEVAGDAISNALALVDGLAVIGGGVSGAWPMFLPALVEEMNGQFTRPPGVNYRRLVAAAFNLEDPAQLKQFLCGNNREITVPGSSRKIQYDPLARVGVGISRLGTSEAIAIGAYAFALDKLDS